jgi:hypothetical protein
MKRSVDHELVAQLLADESLSYREIARRANCSDFSVRAIARQLDADVSEDVDTSDPLGALEWCAVLGVGALIVAGLLFAAWRQR